MPKKVQKFEWNDNRYRAAKLLSEGVETQQHIADDVGVNEKTLRRWKDHKVFMEYVDKLTLDNELASRAGLLRAMYKGASLKEDNIKEDKSTHLDYMKGIAKVQGLESQNVNVTGAIVTTEHDLISDPEVLEAANALARKIAQSKEDDK